MNLRPYRLLPPIALAALLGACADAGEPPQLTRADIAHARAVMRHYGCGACHTVEGVIGAKGLVGPSLVDVRKRVYIAGVAPNTAENLAQFIREPRSISPSSAMPNLGVSPREARVIVDYLYFYQPPVFDPRR